MDTLCLKLWHSAEFSTTKDVIWGVEKRNRLYSEHAESQKWEGSEAFTKTCIKQVRFIENISLFLLISTSLKKVVGPDSFLNFWEHFVYSSSPGKIFMTYTVL